MFPSVFRLLRLHRHLIVGARLSCLENLKAIRHFLRHGEGIIACGQSGAVVVTIKILIVGADHCLCGGVIGPVNNGLINVINIGTLGHAQRGICAKMGSNHCANGNFVVGGDVIDILADGIDGNSIIIAKITVKGFALRRKSGGRGQLSAYPEPPL